LELYLQMGSVILENW